MRREAAGDGERGGALDHRDAFILAVAHDLRASVAALTGTVGVLRRRFDDLSRDEIAALLDAMGDAARAANEVIANLFDAERLEHGAIHPVRVPTDLGRLVARTVAVSGVADRTRLDVDDAIVVLDPGLTQRILANLVDNAVAHTPTGTPITVTARARTDHVELRVDDEGPGIPPELREHVFEPFHRSTRRGMGVGLYLVREFARLHGGDASLLDRPAGGTSVQVRLPVS